MSAFGRPDRSYELLDAGDLERLGEIARRDRNARFAHKPRWAVYADRILCVALCQGAALHYVTGETGVKDLDVWTFYATSPEGPFPPRWRTVANFGPSKFGRRRVDLIGRSLPVAPTEDPVKAVRHYLRNGVKDSTPWCLAQKAVVLIDPPEQRGQVIWPEGIQ
jgi:hypothetical protein